MLLDKILPKLLEHCYPCKEEEGKCLYQKVGNAEKKLTQDFTEEQKIAFAQYLDAVTTYQCFEQGYLEKISFSLGGKLMEEMNEMMKNL